MKLRTAEGPPPGAGVNTVTGIDPAASTSAAVMAARSRVAPTTVVGRSAPFQRTTEAATKPLPFTVSVNPGLPATALSGERLLSTGTTDEVGAGAVGRAGMARALHA
jgi:hypothetical protein